MTSKPLVCVTVAAATTEELCARRDAIEVTDVADLIELRLDDVRTPDVAAALAGRRKPVIVTCRPAWEGGGFGGSEEERHRLLRDARARGAEYIDVEWRAGFDDLVRSGNGRGIVLSAHDFHRVPRDLAAQYEAMRATGAEIVKIAVTAERLADMLPLLDLTRPGGASHVILAMGAAGVATRVLAARFGSCWSYAGEGIAPGQVSPRALVEDFQFRRVSAATTVYGVLGRPIGHSLSPAMHNAAFAHLGIDAVYVPLEAADADDFFQTASALRVRGASVTAPYKRDAFDRADVTDEMTRRVGALNTLKHEDGRWHGINTDVEAFLGPLEARMRLDGARVAILGAGGAARAVAIGAASRGARVAVYARRKQAAEDVARLVAGTASELPPPHGSWDVLVNATPVGTWPHADEAILSAASLNGRLVYDLVYNPARTRLLEEAARAGCETIGGLAMLVAQAQRQCEWWTGARPPAQVMEMAAARSLAAVLAPGEGGQGAGQARFGKGDRVCI